MDKTDGTVPIDGTAGGDGLLNAFGCMVFNDAVMRVRLPGDVYRILTEAASRGAHLAPDIADAVADAMMKWAVEHGATHYTHWFQPMTGATAEKHESFLSPAGGGSAILEFSGKALVHGEPDASSLPSGGLRATFEARGYTVWDLNSYAFIKDGSLCIPTAFCSYGGDALDKKTPLLRSMEAVEKQALRVLRLFGNATARRAMANVGAEQEYFLIDKGMYKKRPDLVNTGRTLFGARPPKGQELDDHYYGILKPRVSAFMKDLDKELWKLGVYAKTRHNETAPAQHELVPAYITANIATDHNQLVMELMKSVSDRHGLVCLLNEKPFAGINGSGKHNNWSIITDTGLNLLEQGETPNDNAQFLLFLVALIKAVDEYQDLLRASAACAGNDHRLGGNEAPPAIVSIYIGDELTEILEALENGSEYINKGRRQARIGVTSLPQFPVDSTDRNRTSPLAFTGNKFEFRMPGAAFSIAEPNIVLNTAVAEALRQFADALENAGDLNAELAALIKTAFHDHKRIVFNGNNYSSEWSAEAKRRGLSNLATTVDALPELVSEKSAALFARHCVFTKTELRSRYEIQMEGYCKTLHIEALTMIDIVKGLILPASVDYQNDLAKLLAQKQALGGFDASAEEYLLGSAAGLTSRMLNELAVLEGWLADGRLPSMSDGKTDICDLARFFRDKISTAMADLRLSVDGLEALVAKKYWPLPSYAEILNSVV